LYNQELTIFEQVILARHLARNLVTLSTKGLKHESKIKSKTTADPT